MESTIPDTLSAIERPRLCRLAVQIEPAQLRAVIWNTTEDASMVQFSLHLDPTKPVLRALEDAIYAAPVLLSDFAATDVLVFTPDYMVVHADAPLELCDELVGHCCLWPDDAVEREVMTDAVDALDVKVVWPEAQALLSFLARTFRNPRVMCHAGALLRYFCSKAHLGNNGKVYAHLYESGADRWVDVFAFKAGGVLQAAATHKLSSTDDAIYYILATMQQFGLDPKADEVLLCGNNGMRESVMPQLRRYAAYVMPLIFPSAAFRSGKDALKAPFPLITLPLCE